MEEFDSSKDIETRKVQKLGSSSLFITLPKKWINKWSIKPGDKILIEVSDDGSLKLLAEKVKLIINKKSIKIDVDSLKQPMPSIIPCLYSLGYDEIVFESKKPLMQKDIEDIIDVTKQMVGSEVTEASDGRIKVECLLDSEKVGLESLLRRMLNVISKKVDDIVAYITNEPIKDNLNNNEDLRRIYFMLLRRVMSIKYDTSKNITKNFFIVMNSILLLNTGNLIDKLTKLIKSEELTETEKGVIKDTLQKVNDLLDEVVMTVLFPSIKRVSNGIMLIKQVKYNISTLDDKKYPLLFNYLQDLIASLESALDNSSCTLFLEDMPWIERNLTA
ncbi:AbrB/MazE/SpoVT family DNA-binding domain-containing protein [Acidianus brierleyi]|uniref:AbrB/MazE/SpoVT family DNA-binding domain-containing protein n=1 Tax=Acidianus brierleyi TaxID=41673 RepID=UPI0014432627|nr:AbrB/MazE/SpoVT family DNA-binding domain-containing protein [Acidianus brierleyi]AWR95988.2 AbrB/MazE/SpoVT family DNA-binding domain-containing protein [Acidianus brierleyi]